MFMPRREISPEKPLLHFKYNDPDIIPADLLPFAAICVDALHEGYEKYLDANLQKNLPVVMQTENWNSYQRDWAVTPARLDEVLAAYENIVAVSVVEMSCFALNEEQKHRILEMARVCGKYGVYLIWEDMGYPDRKHVFARAGDDEEFIAFLQENPQTFIFVDKVNGWGQYHLTRSMAMGYWLCGYASAWGINVEDFWWYEQGYNRLYQDGDSRSDYYHPLFQRLGPSIEGMIVSILEFGCPEALMGQILAAAMLQGASIISFECADRMIASGKTRTPLFNRVLYPLQAMAVNEQWLPGKAEVLDKIKAAYVADDWESELFCLPAEQPFLDLYCPARALDKVKKDNSSGSILQSTGRYYVVPVVPAFARSQAAAVFSTLLDSQSQDRRAFFDAYYPNPHDTDMCIVQMSKRWLFSHTEENADIVQSFRNVTVAGFTLNGTFQPHSYMLITETDEGMTVHLNNFRSDANAAVYDNRNFSRSAYIESYIKDDCPFLGQNRETVLSFAGTPAIHAEGAAELFISSKEGYTTVSLWHNGPVNLRVTI